MKKYYYIKDGNQLGPFDLGDLRSEEINRETLIWFQGSKNWVKASEIIEFNELLSHLPPPVPYFKTKKYLVIELVLTLILVVSTLFAWIEIESVLISAPIGIAISVLAFYYSSGGDIKQKATSLVSIHLTLLVILYAAIGQNSNVFRFFSLEAFIKIIMILGTLLYVVNSYSKKIYKSNYSLLIGNKNTDSNNIIENNIHEKSIEIDVRPNKKSNERTGIFNYFSYNNEYISGNIYFVRILISSLTSIVFGIGLWLFSSTVYKRSISIGLSIRFATVNSITLPILFIVSFFMGIYYSKREYLSEEVLYTSLLVRILLGLPNLILLFKNGKVQHYNK